MSLNSYGSIMAFAIELEGKMQHYYDSVASFDDTFADYARRYAKRKSRMAQVRQEYVTEMVLEPITGLEMSDYEPQASEIPSDRSGAIAKAIRLEANAQKFYVESSAKLNVTEAIRTFQKFGQECGDRLIELNKMKA